MHSNWDYAGNIHMFNDPYVMFLFDQVWRSLALNASCRGGKRSLAPRSEMFILDSADLGIGARMPMSG